MAILYSPTDSRLRAVSLSVYHEHIQIMEKLICIPPANRPQSRCSLRRRRRKSELIHSELFRSGCDAYAGPKISSVLFASPNHARIGVISRFSYISTSLNTLLGIIKKIRRRLWNGADAIKGSLSDRSVIEAIEENSNESTAQDQLIRNRTSGR